MIDVIEEIRKGRIVLLNDNPELLFKAVEYIGMKDCLNGGWAAMISDNVGYYLLFHNSHPFSWITEEFKQSAWVPEKSYNTEQVTKLISFDRDFIHLKERYNKEIEGLKITHGINF